MSIVENDKWGLIELKKDPLYKRLTELQKNKIIDEAILLGNEFAKKALALFGQPVDFYEIKSIIKNLGGRVVIYENAYPPRYLAEYDEIEKTVTLYRMNIENVAMRLGADSPILKGYDLISLCAAHELFHHLDNEKWQGSSKGISIEITFFKILKRKCYPRSAREIAAHAFVKKFLNLDISPALLESALLESHL